MVGRFYPRELRIPSVCRQWAIGNESANLCILQRHSSLDQFHVWLDGGGQTQWNVGQLIIDVNYALVTLTLRISRMDWLRISQERHYYCHVLFL